MAPRLRVCSQSIAAVPLRNRVRNKQIANTLRLKTKPKNRQEKTLGKTCYVQNNIAFCTSQKAFDARNHLLSAFEKLMFLNILFMPAESYKCLTTRRHCRTLPRTIVARWI